MRTMRSAAAATSSSCVTIRIVWPPACSRRNSSSTSWPPSESSAPVGSSASSNVGSLASARAIASRWRCPPDSTPGRVLRLVGEAEEVEQVACTRLRALPRRARDHRGQRHVLEHAHAFEQVEELEDDADVAAPQDRELVFALAHELLARERHLAVGRRVEPGDDVEQRRLPAARRPHHRDELAAATVKSTPRECAHRGSLRLERLAQTARDDHRDLARSVDPSCVISSMSMR